MSETQEDIRKRNRENQRRRRAKLKRIAQELGYPGWSQLTTAVLNGEVELRRVYLVQKA